MAAKVVTSESDVVPPRSFERLAIIFCAKNCEKTIGNAIASVNEARFPNMDSITIVIDGFSTDSTAKAAKDAGGTSVIQQPDESRTCRGY